MTPARLCRDCKHCIPDQYFRWPKWWHLLPPIGWLAFFVGIEFRGDYWRYAQCALTVVPDYVASRTPNMASARFCSTERRASRENACGPAAVHFEEKES